METALLSSALTATCGLFRLCCAKTKCYCRRNDEKPCQYGCGFTKKNLLGSNDDDETEIRVEKINGLDIMYIHRKSKYVVSNDTSSSGSD